MAKLETANPGEKLKVDWNNMKITGVESGFFKQSIPIENYNKRIEEYNLRPTFTEQKLQMSLPKNLRHLTPEQLKINYESKMTQVPKINMNKEEKNLLSKNNLKEDRVNIPNILPTRSDVWDNSTQHRDSTFDNIDNVYYNFPKETTKEVGRKIKEWTKANIKGGFKAGFEGPPIPSFLTFSFHLSHLSR